MRAVLLAAIAACAAAPSRPRPVPSLELVESWPAGTTLDSELRDAADVWLEMVAAAKQSIDIAEFYLSNEPNSRLDLIVVALEAALARGVRVRLLVEPTFDTVYPDTIERLVAGGSTVRRAKLEPGILHAKYFIVDGRDAYLGSQNFDWRSLEHIVELGARFSDPALVRDLQTIFAYDWASAGNEPATPVATMARGQGAIRLAASPRDRLPPGIEWDLPPLLAMIDGARTSVRLQALTYRAGEWTEIQDALVRAVGRGVRVELLVADWMTREHAIRQLHDLAAAAPISIKLVTIPQADHFIPFARVTHAKLVVVDGSRGWMGTSNFEKDYFYASRNVGLLVDDAALAGKLDRFFEHVWSSSYARVFDPRATYTPPRVE